MKNIIVAANWKSNKTKREARQWFDEISNIKTPDNLEIIVFPPLTLLDFASNLIREKNLQIKLGAQNVSPFGPGAYTGEINGQQIKEFADYVLIGHSERRINFHESDEMINRKIDQALSLGIIPIVCVSNINQVKVLNRKIQLIAYEPIEAIGTGNSEDPKTVEEFVEIIKEEKENAQVLYGGSVNAGNIKTYINIEQISGVLVGGESLDPLSFLGILKNAV